MLLDFDTLSPNRIYHTLIQTLIPRPIAWVLSGNADGSHNLAPFSYFGGVSSDPPLVMLSMGRKRDGSPKDSRANIAERGCFVIHIAHRQLAEALNDSSEELPAGVSERERLALATVPLGDFPLPRLAASRVAFACRLHSAQEIGAQALFLGRIESCYVDDAIAEMGPHGRLRVDARALDPLARLGGDEYGLLGDVFSLRRP